MSIPQTTVLLFIVWLSWFITLLHIEGKSWMDLLVLFVPLLVVLSMLLSLVARPLALVPPLLGIAFDVVGTVERFVRRRKT